MLVNCDPQDDAEVTCGPDAPIILTATNGTSFIFSKKIIAEFSTFSSLPKVTC